VVTVSTRYQHASLVLVRATTDPGDLDPPTWLDLSNPAAVEGEGRAWLAKVWARPEVREALRSASPALGARLDQLLGEQAGPRPVKELRRAVVSVASYLLRWQRRATPVGMFAGVAAAVGPALGEVGAGHRAVMRADAEWVATLVNRLEGHPRLRMRLTVVADSARFVRDGRVIVHPRAEIGAPMPGPLRESSVRLTRPVRFALDAAGSPIRLDVLAARMTAQFPAASPDTVHTLLHGLVDAGVLITSLRPAMTAADALSDVIRALRAADADELADLAGLPGELDEISAALAPHTNRLAPSRLRASARHSSGG